MRTARTNPFEPGADRVPQVWAGRQDLLADWRDRLRPRRMMGQSERGRTLLGDPGIGKSVLVRRITRDARRAGDWVTPQLRVPRGVDPLPLVASAVLDLAEQAGLVSSADAVLGGFLDRLREVSAMGASLTLAPAPAVADHTVLTKVLVAVSRTARDLGKVVVVHIDEVQNITDDDRRSQLLVALGDALGHEDEVRVPGGTAEVGLPLAVYLTGLPEFHDQASTRSGATFARRFATTVLDPISDADLRLALATFVFDGWPVAVDGRVELVSMTPDAVDAIIECCQGDPFLFQLVGQAAWDAGEAPTITAADVRAGWATVSREARTHVERLVSRLPELERAFVEVMAELASEDRTLTSIARKLGYAHATQLGATAQRLDTVRGIVDRGRPYTFRVRTVEAYLQGGWP